MSSRMHVEHSFAADVESVYALMSDVDFLTRKYTGQGATDIVWEPVEEAAGGVRRLTCRRKLTVDLPGFAKKVMQPTNTVVQVDEWDPAGADGVRTCRYSLEVQGVPSRITGTVRLEPDGDRTRQVIDADVKVSIPLLGGRLEKFAVDSGKKQLAGEADFTDAALQG